MATKTLQAGEELQRLADMFKGVGVAAEQLKSVGKLDAALTEREARLKKLTADIAGKKKSLAEREAESDASVEAAWREAERAKVEAAKVISDAHDTAAHVAAAAKKAAEDVVAEREKQLQAREAEAVDRLKAINAEIKQRGDALKAADEAIKAKEAEVSAIDQKLNQARTRVTKLMEGVAQ